MTEPSKSSCSSTEAVHAGSPYQRPHDTLTPSIALTATYTFRDTADLERYMRGQDPNPDREEYGRYGNPTVRELETLTGNDFIIDEPILDTLRQARAD